MAIEKVHLYQNTSVVPDEVLVHRIGLIPILADARKFNKLSGQEMDTSNTLVFTLKVKCRWNPDSSDDSAEQDKYIDSDITSGHLNWVPQGDQLSCLAGEEAKPVSQDIMIAKLRPGQEIEAELFCEKNIGRVHAKWSPVCTASYKLLPEVVISKPILGENAQVLVDKCPMGVFDIENLDGSLHATVSDSNKCTMCRECITDPAFVDSIGISKIRKSFCVYVLFFEPQLLTFISHCGVCRDVQPRRTSA